MAKNKKQRTAADELVDEVLAAPVPTLTLSADNPEDVRDLFLIVKTARSAVGTDRDRLRMLLAKQREFDLWVMDEKE